MINKVLFWNVILLLFIMICVAPNLDTEIHTKAKPEQMELVGKYIPTSDTREFIKQGGYKSIESSITLSDDGSFEMLNMPDWWNTDFGHSKGGFDSGQGMWNVDKCQEWWCLRLEFSSREKFNSYKSFNGLTTSVTLVGQSPPYRLWFYVGDPDEGDVMIFEPITSTIKTP